MIKQQLQNEYSKKEVDRMSAIKMGLTIEEAAECTGIGRNTMRKLVEWGKLPSSKWDARPLSAGTRWSGL